SVCLVEFRGGFGHPGSSGLRSRFILDTGERCVCVIDRRGGELADVNVSHLDAAELVEQASIRHLTCYLRWLLGLLTRSFGNMTMASRPMVPDQGADCEQGECPQQPRPYRWR